MSICSRQKASCLPDSGFSINMGAPPISQLKAISILMSSLPMPQSLRLPDFTFYTFSTYCLCTTIATAPKFSLLDYDCICLLPVSLTSRSCSCHSYSLLPKVGPFQSKSLTKYLFMYLKGRVAKREGKRTPRHCLLLQMATAATTWPDQSQVPGTLSKSPT